MVSFRRLLEALLPLVTLSYYQLTIAIDPPARSPACVLQNVTVSNISDKEIS